MMAEQPQRRPQHKRRPGTVLAPQIARTSPDIRPNPADPGKQQPQRHYNDAKPRQAPLAQGVQIIIVRVQRDPCAWLSADVRVEIPEAPRPGAPPQVLVKNPLRRPPIEDPPVALLLSGLPRSDFPPRQTAASKPSRPPSRPPAPAPRAANNRPDTTEPRKTPPASPPSPSMPPRDCDTTTPAIITRRAVTQQHFHRRVQTAHRRVSQRQRQYHPREPGKTVRVDVSAAPALTYTRRFDTPPTLWRSAS